MDEELVCGAAMRCSFHSPHVLFDNSDPARKLVAYGTNEGLDCVHCYSCILGVYAVIREAVLTNIHDK